MTEERRSSTPRSAYGTWLWRGAFIGVLLGLDYMRTIYPDWWINQRNVRFTIDGVVVALALLMLWMTRRKR